jgi:hypothetical protein
MSTFGGRGHPSTTHGGSLLGDDMVADVVTKDNWLLQRFDVNRHKGFIAPEES